MESVSDAFKELTRESPIPYFNSWVVTRRDDCTTYHFLDGSQIDAYDRSGNHFASVGEMVQVMRTLKGIKPC